MNEDARKVNIESYQLQIKTLYIYYYIYYMIYTVYYNIYIYLLNYFKNCGRLLKFEMDVLVYIFVTITLPIQALKF